MSDIIHLLPDSVANQIAAGEVVQRPASVIKELVENAIDAHATEITISLTDAGRTAIQITDNGCGMSETDARMAFERHATSKISDAADIFKIRSMGFRGEALASIAAVAQVELKTCKQGAELGTKICISGSKVELQEPNTCAVGTSFLVKNLFFNTPARRKFLKSNQTEFNYILAEIQKTAIANPAITFTIIKDGELYAKYPAGNHKQRIVSIFGKNMEKGLLRIDDNSSIAKIYGFVGVPELARKNSQNQFFFVNDRYFRQKSFLGAVMRAYGNLLQPKEFPPFFIFLEIDPAEIDINIHPTKTEIKFSEEFNICQLLEATVRCSLGKNNIVPSLDFSDSTNYSDLFAPQKGEISAPQISVDNNYNPFRSSGCAKQPYNSNTADNQKNWEKLFDDYQRTNNQADSNLELSFSSKINNPQPSTAVEFCTQFQKKYIIAFVGGSFWAIDIKRAHYRLMYNHFSTILQQQSQPSQKTLIDTHIELSPTEAEMLKEILPHLQEIGFGIREFGANSFAIDGVPANVSIADVESMIDEFITLYGESAKGVKESVYERIARSMAKSASLFRNPEMSQYEMQQFASELLNSEQFTITPEGQLVCVQIAPADLIKNLN